MPGRLPSGLNATDRTEFVCQFGLPGLWVERVERLDDGTRVVTAVTADETATAA